MASSSFPLLSLLVFVVTTAQADQCDYNAEDKSFHCQIRTLQSGLDNDVDIEKASKIRVQCSDFSFTESRINSEHFGQLPSLEELQIEFCKIRQLPSRSFVGLGSLKKLSLQSHNSEWSSVLMEVDAHSLKNLSSLEELNMAHNSLWSLPSGVLCDLPRLKKVNFSVNHIMAVSDLGLSSIDGCKSFIESLDLSSNFISTLQKDDLLQTSSGLVQLNLAGNRMSILGDNALDSLRSLQELNLSDNQLAALPPTLFNQSQQLQRLHLQNNSLTLLPPGVFSGLSNLAVLNLSGNAISSHLLSAETFSGLTALQVLDLSDNQMTKIDTNTFQHLARLQILNLQNNKVHIISAKAFFLQTHLRILSLSHNSIETVTEDAFEGLSSLQSLSLDNNKISSCNIASSSVSSLTDLALNDNLLPSIPSFVRLATRMRTLDLGDNAIQEVTPSDLHNLSSLYGLRLSGNKLKSVSNVTFANSVNIHILNLAHNEISSIESGALNVLKELRALRLDNNRLEDINGLVSSLGKLQWLNVSSNALQWFDYAFISSSLEWLDVSHNQLSELGNFYGLDGFGIKTLDASFNKIKRVDAKSFPEGVFTVDVRSNEIEAVEAFTFANQQSLKRVDLSGNYIAGMLPDALRINSRTGRPDFSLSGNPLKCDCQQEWLQEINSLEAASSFALVSDLDSLECMLPTTRELVPLKSVEKSAFLCEYKAHCSAQCMCCDFFACDCRFQCPEGCDCFHDQTWTENVVQCAQKKHTNIPLLIPLDATQVHLDGNNFRHIDTQSFLGRGHIKELYLNNSNIISLGNHTFSGLSSLEVLHLEDNNIGEIRGFEFAALSNLKHLFLHNNDLVYINEVAFEPLKQLLSLTLDGNLLTVFPVWYLLNNPLLNSLTLSRNTWSCECDFIQPFNFFLEKKSLTIGDYEAIQCVSENVIDDDAFRNGNLVRCGKSNNELQQESTSSLSQVPTATESFNVVPIVVPMVVAAVILILGFLSVFVFRKSIKTWLYSKSSQIYESRSGSSVTSSSGSTYAQNKLFDVYISYSAKDADFVDQSLAPTLEQGTTSYKLCLHQRDFPPTASLYDTVSVATESSARVIIVLSKSYLDTEWPHVKIPLRNTLTSSDKLILLFVEDLTEADLRPHPELVQHLQTCACVRWGSSGFLNKLRFFLPEPAFLTFQRNITLRHQQQTLRPLPPPANSALPPIPPVPVSFYRSNLDSLQYHPYTVYGTPRSDHTYHSIPDNHIYHTLEPNNANLQKQKQQKSLQNINASVLLSRDLELVLRNNSKAVSPSSSVSPVMFHHSHSHSTSSGTQLLPPTSKDTQDEYIV